MKHKDPEKRRIEFIKSFPESVTGPKADKEYPLKNIEYFGHMFKQHNDGTIYSTNISSSIEWVVKGLYDHGFLTVKPLFFISSVEGVVNTSGESNEWITVRTYLDKTGN